MSIIISKTPEFDKWFYNIKDIVFIKQFDNRIKRIEQGNFGFNKRLSEYLYELKFSTGKGYRVYYMIGDNMVILWGGVKDTQSKDIKKANQILDNIRSE